MSNSTKKVTKRLSIRPIDFESPQKKQIKLSTPISALLKESPKVETPINTHLNLIKKPLLDNIFNSPIKSMPKFNLCSPSPGPSNLEILASSLDLMKTPSPRKRLNTFIVCQNVGMPTPDKKEESEEENLMDKPFLTVQGPKIPKKRILKKKCNENFVKINLRRKSFAPSNRMNLKKKFFKGKKNRR